MSVRIEAGGRTRTVEVRRGDAGFIVSLDGREHAVDVNQAGATWSLLLGTRSYEVSFVEGPDGAMMVHVNGRAVPVTIVPARPAWRDRGRTAASQGAGQGAGVPQRIVAPMPGKIVKVLVTPGDRVDARQGLVIVEAMKMENELRSRQAGTVSQVLVKEGASVEAGAILVIVE